MSASLRQQAIRLAASLPKGSPERRALLASLQKSAHAGYELLDRILDPRKFEALYHEVEKQDPQAAELLYEVRQALASALKISDNEYNALGRVQQLVAAQGRWDIGLQRNNIFKAADLLGMKLPSFMFASTHTAAGVTPKVIAQIADMIDQNDHGGAVLTLAKALGETKIAKMMEHVIGIHHLMGSMPSELITFRNKLSEHLLAQAKKKLDADTYEKLYQAF
jgi:hypothetical protein